MKLKNATRLISGLLAFALVFGVPGNRVLADSESNPTNVAFLIDISGSMVGAKIEAVKLAVQKLILGLPADISVQVFTFNDHTTEIIKPTFDRQLAISKINSISAGRGTAIYDALADSIAKSNPGTHIILLSDGEDTNSSTRLSTLVKVLNKTSVQVDSIGLQTSSTQAKILSEISVSTSGDFYSIDNISLLLSTYQKAIRNIVKKPTTASPTPKTPKPIENSALTQQNVYVQWVLYALSISIGLLLFIALIWLRRTVQKKRVFTNRVQNISKYDVRININPFSSSFDAQFLKKYIPKKLRRYVENQLDFIHSKVSPEVIFAVFPVAWLIVALVLNSIFHNFVIAAILSLILTPIVFDRSWKFIRRRQKKDFENELPELLNLLASALRSGLSLQQGLEAFSADNTGELARQIRRAIAEIHVGTPIDEALMKVAVRMDNEDLRWTVTALSIQKTVGGSMATIISSVHETISGRAEIRREVRTLSAEGKLSAYVLIGLPIGLFLYLMATKPDYASLLWTHPLGIAILIYVIVSIVVGWLWMKKIVNIKV